VLSAWRGWRPLASDPNLPPGAPVSRDHIISHNPDTGVLFCAGGKWTTWREMAQDVVSRLVKEHNFAASDCQTLEIGLLGRDQWDENLPIRLVQQAGCRAETAEHLSKTYGGRSWDVLELAKPTGRAYPNVGVPLAEGYPYIEAEVRYAAREYAVTVEDILSRRTRLAFLNSRAAIDAIPRVAEIMAEELGWSAEQQAAQEAHAHEYMAAYGGPDADKSDAKLRSATPADLRDIFDSIDTDGSGKLSPDEVRAASEALGFPLREGDEWTRKAFDAMDKDRSGQVREAPIATCPWKAVHCHVSHSQRSSY